jgi:thiol:disulfide interchange protein DsbD
MGQSSTLTFTAMFRFTTAIFLGLAALLTPVSGQLEGFGLPGVGETEKAKEITAGLIADVKAVAPGSKFQVGVTLDHAPEWHSYWKNPGGFSLPVEVKWELPAGFKVGSPRWPVPKQYISQGFPAYINPDKTVIVYEMEAPAGLDEGASITIKAKVGGQVCKEECVIFDENVSLTLAAAAAPAAHETGAKKIADALAALAKPLQGWTATAEEKEGMATLTLAPGEGAAAVSDAYFFSHSPHDIDSQAEQSMVVENGHVVLTLKRPAEADQKPGPNLSGILFTKSGWLKDNPASTAMEIDIAIGGNQEAAPPPAATAPEQKSLTLVMVGIAFLGGLILNLMPCVFPVLGLKIMNFVNQSGEDHRKVVMHGIVFTVGVLVSFWVLAGVIIGVKHFTGTDDLQWGFQLQDARFVWIMTLVLFLFSLSLAGLFEFGTSATSIGGNLTRKSGLSGSFFSGVLATLVATPCAAPFLATALGAALSLPPLPSIFLFTVIGLGLSMPYLVLSAFPKLVDHLPRPGAWMETFKKLMSFPMFATAAWLLWVLSQQVDVDRFLWVLLALTASALAAYVFGHWGQAWQKTGTKRTAWIVTALLLAGSVVMAWPRPTAKQLAEEARAAGRLPDSVVWEEWSPERVADLRAKGTPVFIDFTAAWCATCLANKARYTGDKQVIELIEKKGVAMLKADFTNKDPKIAAALVAYDRRAVPVNILYAPGAEKPIFFPSLFGASEILENFSALPDKAGK